VVTFAMAEKAVCFQNRSNVRLERHLSWFCTTADTCYHAEARAGDEQSAQSGHGGEDLFVQHGILIV
jgi:hypothetical protein